MVSVAFMLVFMISIQLTIIFVDQMFPSYQHPFQPYFLLPTMATTFSPFIYQNGYPFPLQGPTAHLSFSTASFNELPMQTPRQPILVPTSLPSIQNRINEVVQEQDSLHSPSVRKEKVIKKQPNRPATYLTQRKYYLAQNLPQQDTSGRKLRPRNKKKKVRSNHRNQHKTDPNVSFSPPSHLQKVQTIPTPLQKAQSDDFKNRSDSQRMIAGKIQKEKEREQLCGRDCVVKTED